MKNQEENSKNQNLSRWWRRGLVIILLLEFAILIWVTAGSYYREQKPPVPGKVSDSSGLVIFTNTDIQNGQKIFLKKALMDNGSIWGHGAYMGPDFSAQYLHNLAEEINKYLAAGKYNTDFSELTRDQKESLVGLTGDFLAKNRYNHENLHFPMKTELKSHPRIHH